MKNIFKTEEKAKLILRALTNKTRIEILEVINSKGRINVTDLYVKLKMVQAVPSQHLAILRKANIVVTERNGKMIYYSINYEKLHKINEGSQIIIGEI